MYTDFNDFFTVTARNVSRVKVKLHLPPRLYSVTPYLAKHITTNINATFSNVQHSKVYSKQFSSPYSILAYLFTAMLYKFHSATTVSENDMELSFSGVKCRGTFTHGYQH